MVFVQKRSLPVALVTALVLFVSMFVMGVMNAAPAKASDEFSIPLSTGGATNSERDGWSGGVGENENVRKESNTGKTAAGGDGETRLRSDTPQTYLMIKRTTTTFGGAPNCGARTISTGSGSLTQSPIGQTKIDNIRLFWADGDPDSGAFDQGKTRIMSTEYVCHYAAAYQDTRVVCVTNMNLNLQMVVPTNKGIFNRDVSSAFNGNRTLANCLNSGGSVSANIPVKDMGRYLGTAEAYAVACYHRRYIEANPDTGIIPGDELVNCGGQYRVAHMQTRAQIDCTGAYRDWRGNPSWTMTECSDQQSNNPVFRCEVGNSVKVNGAATTATELLRNGGVNRLEWDTPSISGNDIVGYSYNGTTMKRGGTPWITGRGASNNLFELGLTETGTKASMLNDSGIDRQGGVHTTWFGRWYAASDSGAPTVLQPVYDFTATVRVTTWTITSINPNTGDMTFVPSTRDIATSGTCDGPALSVSTLKVVNDVN